MFQMKVTIAAAAATLALAISAKADEKIVSYNLTPGACSAPIAIPLNNMPVALSGTDLEPGYEGVGQVEIVRANKNSTPVLTWTGTDFPTGTRTGYTSAADVHIISLDSGAYVDIKTAASKLRPRRTSKCAISAAIPAMLSGM
jgi:hypothetical protein